MKFRCLDRVKVLHDGSTGVVFEVDHTLTWPYGVRYDDSDDGYEDYHLENELVLVERPDLRA